MKQIIKESVIDYIWSNYLIKLSVLFHWLFILLERFMEIPVNDLLQSTTSLLSLILAVIKLWSYIKKHQKPPKATTYANKE